VYECLLTLLSLLIQVVANKSGVDKDKEDITENKPVVVRSAISKCIDNKNEQCLTQCCVFWGMTILCCQL
jgi:hypothetical protein